MAQLLGQVGVFLPLAQGLDPLPDGAEGGTISTIGSFIGKWSGFFREGEARRRGGGRCWLRGHEEADPHLDDIGFHPQHMQGTAKLAAKKLAFLILLLILVLSLLFILLLSGFLTALLIRQEAAG